MGKSKVTQFYEERFRTRLRPEPPTPEEALEAIDYETGLELIDRIQELRADLDKWMTEYVSAVDWSDVPQWQRGLDTLQPIRRLLNDSRTWLDRDRRNFIRWSERQTHEPNILFKAS